ncbi:MAG: hypothetical protein AB7G28_05180 [Pirellulales bacterium]
MQTDFEIQRSTRRCAATDRPLAPGEWCYSVLEVQGAEIVRKDFAASAWPGAPAESFGWWKARVPEPHAKKIKLAPNEVLLELFDQLAEQPHHEDMRYVLALLLVRRRVLRLDGPTLGAAKPFASADVQSMTVFCPLRDASYEVSVVMPSDERIEAIQKHLNELLVSGTESVASDAA